MKNINILKIVLLLFTVSLFVSCDEGGDPDPGATSIVEMSGDWYVQLSVDGVLNPGYELMSTYNTAANNGTDMWLDDHKNIYWFKFKSPINISQLTFSGANLESSVVDDNPSTPNVIETYDITATVNNGVIIKKGAIAPSGTVVDSISFNVEFSDDPGTIYQIAGYKRTGFLEDEH